MGVNKRRVVDECVVVELDELPNNLRKTIEKLTILFDSIPAAFRNSASFETNEDYESGFFRYAYVRWSRYETDAEVETGIKQEAVARVKAEAKKLATAKAAMRRERATYLRLKKKFEVSP